jgi:hypothetical protein
MPRTLFPAAAALLLMATAVPAQTVLPGDHSVDGDLCVGGSCTGSEVFDSDLNAQLKVKGSGIGIVFEDTAGTSVNDWALKANAPSEDSFFIEDLTGGTVPFKVLGTAPDNSLFVAANGQIGLGTTIPAADLHIQNGTQSNILLQHADGTSFAYSINAGSGGLVLANFTPGVADSGLARIAIAPDAPAGGFILFSTEAAVNSAGSDYNFRVRSDDNTSLIFTDAAENRVGMGTASPDALLHLQRSDSTARLLVEDTGASGAQEMFKLSNNGGSFFTFENTAAGTTWFFTHENSAPNRFIIADAVTDGPEFSLTAEGDVTIPGSFISGSTTLNVPDYVFDDGYALRPLSEVAAFIDDNKHLPDVPSAAQIADAGLDMTAMQMTLLKKVEELTLYTLEQEARLARMDTLEMENAALSARLKQIEAALAIGR